MKENVGFNNLKKLYEKIPSDKRPSDILIEGKSIFELHKTPAQIEIIKVSSRLIDNYMKNLNIENKPFDTKRIAFLPQRFTMTAGEYHDGDFILIGESSEANFGTIIHELIHAQSAEWRSYEETEVEKYLEENNKPVKSGFHRHSNFKILNEGITEKITREIIKNNPNEYEKIKPLFEGRMEEVTLGLEKKFKEEILPMKIKERDEGTIEQEKRIEALKVVSSKNLTEINQEILMTKNDREKEMLIKIRKMNEENLEKDIKYILEIGRIFDGVKYAEDIHAIKIQEIKNNYNFLPEGMTSYNFNVEIISLLVEGIVKFNLKANENLKLNEEGEKVWEELQKAFFQGNTMYLRKIDEVFGQGYLRRIDKLGLLLQDKEENEFLEEIKNTVMNL